VDKYEFVQYQSKLGGTGRASRTNQKDFGGTWN
jgi:hypothetical protein